jgi:hypothetical protein
MDYYFWGPMAHRLNFCIPVKDYGYKTDDKGRPLVSECQKRKFSHYCNAPEVLTLFRELYRNTMGTGDRFVAMWRAVAERYKDNGYIMGFDVLNEPQVAPPHAIRTAFDLVGSPDRAYM